MAPVNRDDTEGTDDVTTPAAFLNPATALTLSHMPEQVLSKIDVVDSPKAPLYSPLTPLGVEASRHIHECKDEVDSPVAPPYSPLTPRVPGYKTIQCCGENPSPLPAMSPSTLELVETLSGIFPGDYSSDTDTDYVPDSEEDSDSSHSIRVKKNNDINIISAKCCIPDSDDDFEAGVSTGTVQTHAAVVHNLVNQDFEIRNETSSTTFHVIRGDETLDQITNFEVQNNDDYLILETQSEPQACRPKKGRKRKHPEHTMAQKKNVKYANLPYHGKNKLMPSKNFIDYTCKCTRQCYFRVSEENRKEEFEKYVLLGSYEAQLLYILNNVKESPKSRSYTLINNKSGKKKARQYRRNYFICDIEVCKDMFTYNFQISSKKVDISLLKKRSGTALKDNRGKAQGGWNKTPQEDVEFIKNIINSLPKYESHYRRENSDSKYLKPGTTIEKIHEIYKDELKTVYGTLKRPVSINTFKRIFYSNFNLRCKPLKKDTCNKCDSLRNKIKNCSSEEKTILVAEKEEHLKRAEELRIQMNQDLQRAKIDEKFECLTYDLEKTLPLPRIPTNIVFYKRQLWLYNSGIHAGSNDVGYCNIWVEGEAGRGAQEVGSCLVRFIKNDLSHEVEDLVLWSDCCGGQNRNIKIILMLKAVLDSHPRLKTITLKYLESGHTFLPNDTDFSKIEYQLKYHQRIYTPDQYINVIKSCKKKNPLKVYRMQRNDFFSTSKMEKKIVNRKTFVTKAKVNWLRTKKILLKRDEKYTIYMENTDGMFEELNIEKRLRGKRLEISEEDLVLLWPNGKEIAQAKLDDLKSIFDFIPKDCLDFYKTLKGNDNITEDVDGFDCVTDFELLIEQTEQTEQDDQEDLLQDIV
ncbi:unnamed protein product [Parnassius mnemosyne]